MVDGAVKDLADRVELLEDMLAYLKGEMAILQEDVRWRCGRGKRSRNFGKGCMGQNFKRRRKAEMKKKKAMNFIPFRVRECKTLNSTVKRTRKQLFGDAIEE